MFCCHGNVKLRSQYFFLFLVYVKQVLNCKFAHLVFYHEEIYFEHGVLCIFQTV